MQEEMETRTLEQRIEWLELNFGELKKQFEEMKKGVPKKRTKKGNAAQLWPHYKESFEKRYNCAPSSNARSMKQLANLVERLGIEDAILTVRYYLEENDRIFLERYHDVGTLLVRAESLNTRRKTNTDIDSETAARRSAQAKSAKSSRQYIDEKYGGTND